MNKIARGLIVATVIVLLLHFLFFWMNFSVDSYYYWAIGNYLKTGVYKFDRAFSQTFTTPPTVSPPAYGMLLMSLEVFPAPDILLHLLQLLLLAGTGIFVYKTLLFFIPRLYARIAACLLILIPGNLVYASLVLTEIGAEFFISLYTWCLVRGLKEKNSIWVGLATGLGFAMTIWKYGFVLFGLYAGVQLIRMQPKKLTAFFLSASGFFILTWWIFTNHQATGVWGLSNYGSMRLWNQIVAEGRTLPDENHESMQILRTYIPVSTNIYKAYYDVMYAVLPYVGNDLSRVDRILGSVAWAAVRTHPIAYGRTAIRLFIDLHRPGSPFWGETFLFESTVYRQYCGKLGEFRMCQPIIKFESSHTLWDAFIKSSTVYYFTVFPFLTLFLFIPSLLFLLWRGNPMERNVALLYFLGTIPIVFFEHLDRRFIVPFYPIIVLVSVIGIRKLTAAIVVAIQKKV